MENSNYGSFSFKTANPFQEVNKSANTEKIPIVNKIELKENIESQQAEEYFSIVKDSPRFNIKKQSRSCDNIPIVNTHECHLVEHECARKSHFEYLKLIKDESNPLHIQKVTLKEYSLEELNNHKTKDDLWISINDKVYDITKYLDYHPGGASILLENGGKVATEEFNYNHPWVNIKNLIGKLQIGFLKK